MLLGAAWQQGLVPVGAAALMRAIELNGVSVPQNKQAFSAGRLVAADPAFLDTMQPVPASDETLDAIVSRRVAFLTAYQNARYAERYRAFVTRVREREAARLPGSERLATAVARALFKLMAYKDEYEVARLHTDPQFRRQIDAAFEGDFTVAYHLAPQLLPGARDARGRPLKRRFGPWMEHAFRGLARLKSVRGTKLDVFGYSRERRMERELIGWYRALIEELLPEFDAARQERIVAMAALPMDIRGFGPVKDAAVADVKTRLAALRDELAPKMAAAA
jgi:indolepyruvate ferredoxin oxidoreductase